MPVNLPSPGELLAALVALPGPPGQEGAVRSFVQSCCEALGFSARTDAKGNLLVSLGERNENGPPDVVVTAHMDEIALLVTGVHHGGIVTVSPLGGVHPWKWGEGPVEILARGNTFIPGVLGFGGIHTNHPASPVVRARSGEGVTWDMARVVTGLTLTELTEQGVRPGTRVCVARSRRTVFPLGGNLIGSYFLDDRADIAAWLLALQMIRETPLPNGFRVLFAATASEEVGGEGALFLLREAGGVPVCIALEIGPTTPDNPFPVDENPTIWVSDGYAASTPDDLDLIADAARDADLSPHFQALSRGGSDASCAASHGLCARPMTLAFGADNSHGFEIMHPSAPENLAHLLVAVLRRLASYGLPDPPDAPYTCPVV